MARRVRKHTTVDRPIEQVWPLVAELDGELRWRAPWVVSLEHLDDGPVGPGSRIRGTTRIAGSSETYVNEVTELSPPRRYAWRGVEVSGAVTGRGAYELEPLEGGRTRVTLDLTYEPVSFVGRLQLPLVGLVAARIVGKMVGQLRHVAGGAGEAPREQG